MPVQTIKDPTPSRPREKLTDGQRIDVAVAPVIEISRTRVMECVGSPPEIVRSERQDADGSADPIACKAAVKERPVTAVVLDHEEADEEACRGHGQQQANPIAVGNSRPPQSPDEKEGHCRD